MSKANLGAFFIYNGKNLFTMELLILIWGFRLIHKILMKENGAGQSFVAKNKGCLVERVAMS